MKLGDLSILCMFPDVFTPSMKAADMDVDIGKYAGEWFEQARLPMWAQKLCTHSKAVYKWNDNSKRIDVYNECLTKNGGSNKIQGWATS